MRPVVEIVRLEEDNLWGTFGVLKINKAVFCVTLELPDRENVGFVSSVPAQQYDCCRHNSPKFGETFKIMHVPGRDKVLFHAGNYVHQTEGCILLAQYFGKLKGKRAVLNSGSTFRQFMLIMLGHDIFHLTIREVY